MGDPLPPEPTHAELRRGHGTVLVLNFNVDEREMYRAALVAAGYDVIVCIDPWDVLRMVASWCPEALVTRILQPNCAIDGVELIRRLRADPRTATMPIVVTASLVEGARLGEAREAGCDACLLLPASPDVVVDAVRRTAQPKQHPFVQHRSA